MKKFFKVALILLAFSFSATKAGPWEDFLAQLQEANRLALEQLTKIMQEANSYASAGAQHAASLLPTTFLTPEGKVSAHGLALLKAVLMLGCGLLIESDNLRNPAISPRNFIESVYKCLLGPLWIYVALRGTFFGMDTAELAERSSAIPLRLVASLAGLVCALGGGWLLLEMGIPKLTDKTLAAIDGAATKWMLNNQKLMATVENGLEIGKFYRDRNKRIARMLLEKNSGLFDLLNFVVSARNKFASQGGHSAAAKATLTGASTGTASLASATGLAAAGLGAATAQTPAGVLSSSSSSESAASEAPIKASATKKPAGNARAATLRLLDDFEHRVNQIQEFCAICRNPEIKTNCIIIGCGHMFHEQCIKTWMQTRPVCPICKNNFQVSDLLVVEADAPAVTSTSSSSSSGAAGAGAGASAASPK